MPLLLARTPLFMRRGGSEEQIFNQQRRDQVMSTANTTTRNNPNTTGFPPVPPEAHQRAAGGGRVADSQDIARACSYLRTKGYVVESHANGHLIVADPVMRSGYGADAGKLIPAGVQPVAVRSMSEAFRFVLARS